MWLFTTIGFFSVVRASRGHVQVRARARADLAQLLRRFRASHVKILRTPTADYPFRIVLPTPTWTGWLAVLGADAESYKNFKDAVHERSPSRAKLYTSVWLLARRIERTP